MASIKGRRQKKPKRVKRGSPPRGLNRLLGVVEAPRGRGQPSKYDPKFAPIAKKMAKLGAINMDLAEAFEVSLNTIKNWQASEPEFKAACTLPKEVANEKVERSLFERATGYSYHAVKIFMTKDGDIIEHDYIEHVPPETAACIFWLKNRKPDEWKDKREYEGGDIKITVQGGLPK